MSVFVRMLARSSRTGRSEAPAQGIELFPEVANGHNGVYQVGELNASPPMILSLRAPTPPLN